MNAALARRVITAALLAIGLTSIAACSVAGSPEAARIPVAAIVMSDPMSGIAVWPSGSRWLLLGTTDGWRTVTNRTPAAVPTDGGLVVAARGAQIAIGVLPFEHLTVSPVLFSRGSGRTWIPTQLPGALAAMPHALARASGSTIALLANGDVVSIRDGQSLWHQVTSAESLDPDGHLVLTGLSVPDGSTVVVTASGPASGPVIFTSADDGATWSAIAIVVAAGSANANSDATATALMLCLAGSIWVASVEVGDHLVVFTAPRLTGPWVAGPPLSSPLIPAVACSLHRVWVAVGSGDSDMLFTSSPGGPWVTQGDLGMRIESLAPVSDTSAMLAGSGPTRLASVDIAGGLVVTSVDLPPWVATVGGTSMRG